MTYLSLFPHGLKEVFITGGLPPLVDQPDTVYDALAREFHLPLQRHTLKSTRSGYSTKQDLLRKVSPGHKTSA